MILKHEKINNLSQNKKNAIKIQDQILFFTFQTRNRNDEGVGK